MPKIKNQDNIVNPLDTELDNKGLVKGIEYFYKDDGRRVDWKKMARTYLKEFIVPNKASFPEGTDFNCLNIDELPDEKILIKLGGWEALADLRGFESIDYTAFAAERHFVSLKCTIVWRGNFETNFRERTCSATADTHPDTLKSFAINFPTAICENRSFGRCVRKFLRIPILSQDELDKNGAVIPENEDSTNVITGIQPINVFRDKCKKHKVTFEQIKNVFIKEGSAPEASEKQVKWKERAEKWTSDVDIVPEDILEIIARLDFKAAEKAANVLK